MGVSVSMQFGKPGTFGGGASGGGGLSLELLWENPNPSAAFAAQTISLNLSGYNAVLVVAITTPLEKTNPECGFTTAFGFVDSDYDLHLNWGSAGTNRVATRKASISSTGVSFLAGRYNNATKNDYTVPYRIYGIR